MSTEEVHRVRGEPARREAAAAPTDALTVVTWNIERGVRYELVLEALRDLDTDIYLLQEVDLFCWRSKHRDVAKDGARARPELGECRGVPGSG